MRVSGANLGSAQGDRLVTLDGTPQDLMYLIDHLHQSRAAVEALGKDDVLPALARAIHGTPEQATSLLWHTYHPQTMWWWFAGLGGVSIFGMVVYHYVVRHLDRRKRATAPAV